MGKKGHLTFEKRHLIFGEGCVRTTCTPSGKTLPLVKNKYSKKHRCIICSIALEMLIILLRRRYQIEPSTRIAHIILPCILQFQGYFYFIISLGLFVLLSHFYLIRFVSYLLTTTPDSNKTGDWEHDCRGQYLLTIFCRKRLQYLFSW